MKKELLAYTITGRTYTGETEYFDWENIIGVNCVKWNENELNGNEPFNIIFSGETVPTNYSIISSMENWDKYGNEVANDYLVIKDQIKILMKEIGWTGLTSQEKDLCIKYYALPDFIQPAIYLMTEKGMSQAQAQGFIIQNWHIHHKKLLEVCNERWYYVKLIVASYLSFYDGEELMDLAAPLIFNFIECGRFGKEYGDQRDGLLDFIISKHGFDNQGLREQGYVLNFGDWDELINNLVNVLLHGIYIKTNGN
jgi:hypothetical protein